MAIPSHYTRENSEYNLGTHFTYKYKYTGEAETRDIGEIPIRDTESKMTWRVEKIKTALSVMLFNWLCLFQFSMLNHIHV